MTQVRITFKELQEFAKENGYLLALYRKDETGNWELRDEIFQNDDDVVLSDSHSLIANDHKGNTNMNETVTGDKKYLFRLHNNCNIPKIIPCF